ncbi:hypothetical protein AVEN_220901-1 [Araneus ventricosus]|uniref:Helitron helicase-like domain-containing protein n=1 Tax=Araneus ventricosus TaxID=182803 RepID=A0A4Y2T331_ARAVE|nr:hypothetical protein AVEN_44705-1 [Araneus ventricosus]GBN95028.1 hypothetical protein AVEN_220901-1 [Araneus ventricosus]
MHERTQDAMTYVRTDLLITFTCDPKWKEITGELLPGQTSVYRLDLIARVFRLKLAKMMKMFTKFNIFGTVTLLSSDPRLSRERKLPHKCETRDFPSTSFSFSSGVTRRHNERECLRSGEG